MREGTGETPSMLLAKLRIGIPLEDILAGLRLEASANEAGYTGGSGLFANCRDTKTHRAV